MSETKLHTKPEPQQSLRIKYNLACPKCGQPDCLKIRFNAIGYLTPAGMEDFETPEWKTDDYCECPICEHKGLVADFTLSDENYYRAFEALEFTKYIAGLTACKEGDMVNIEDAIDKINSLIARARVILKRKDET